MIPLIGKMVRSVIDFRVALLTKNEDFSIGLFYLIYKIRYPFYRMQTDLALMYLKCWAEYQECKRYSSEMEEHLMHIYHEADQRLAEEICKKEIRPIQ